MTGEVEFPKPEEFPALFEKAGLKPARNVWNSTRDGVKCACGLGCLLRLNVPEENWPLFGLLWEASHRFQLSDAFLLGFINGWDGFVRNGAHDFGAEYTRGFAIGKAAAAACGLT